MLNFASLRSVHAPQRVLQPKLRVGVHRRLHQVDQSGFDVDHHAKQQVRHARCHVRRELPEREIGVVLGRLPGHRLAGQGLVHLVPGISAECRGNQRRGSAGSTEYAGDTGQRGASQAGHQHRCRHREPAKRRVDGFLEPLLAAHDVIQPGRERPLQGLPLLRDDPIRPDPRLLHRRDRLEFQLVHGDVAHGLPDVRPHHPVHFPGVAFGTFTVQAWAIHAPAVLPPGYTGQDCIERRPAQLDP